MKGAASKGLRMLTLEEGAFLVKTARKAFFAYIDRKLGSDIPELSSSRLREKIGAYVRVGILSGKNSQHDLILGFTGYPIPQKSVYQSVRDASIAIAARTSSPAPSSNVSFEVTVLSPPQPLKATHSTDVASAIEFGRDAVMITSGLTKAIILPQTAVEKCENQVELLAECCMAAGLMADAWVTSPDVFLYRFRTQIFREEGSEREVIEVSLPGKRVAWAESDESTLARGEA